MVHTCNRYSKRYHSCAKLAEDLENPTPSDLPAEEEPEEPTTLPAPLTPETTKIVKKFDKKVVDITKKITSVNKTIQTLKDKLPTTPVNERPAINTKIVVLKRIVKRFVKKVNVIKRAVIAIRYPTPAPEPTPV